MSECSHDMFLMHKVRGRRCPVAGCASGVVVGLGVVLGMGGVFGFLLLGIPNTALRHKFIFLPQTKNKITFGHKIYFL